MGFYTKCPEIHESEVEGLRCDLAPLTASQCLQRVFISASAFAVSTLDSLINLFLTFPAQDPNAASHSGYHAPSARAYSTLCLNFNLMEKFRDKTVQVDSF